MCNLFEKKKISGFISLFFFQRKTGGLPVKRENPRPKLPSPPHPPLHPMSPPAPSERPPSRGDSTPTCRRSVVPPQTRSYWTATLHGACPRGRSSSGTRSSYTRCWVKGPTTSCTPR